MDKELLEYVARRFTEKELDELKKFFSSSKIEGFFGPFSQTLVEQSSADKRFYSRASLYPVSDQRVILVKKLTDNLFSSELAIRKNLFSERVLLVAQGKGSRQNIDNLISGYEANRERLLSVNSSEVLRNFVGAYASSSDAELQEWIALFSSPAIRAYELSVIKGFATVLAGRARLFETELDKKTEPQLK